ncbi:MAG: molybdate ABC transporter permease subunit [Aquisalimonadaceae bacterium]
MDWTALTLSLELALWTVLILSPVGVLVGRWLAWSRFRSKGVIIALLTLPLVLPPTVLGYYMLVAFSSGSPFGAAYEAVIGRSLIFSFQGLLLASVVVNLPFAVLPMQRAFESVGQDLREAATCCGMSSWRSLRRVELPLAWPGVLSAMVLTFAHTLGEFGVVLMVGGSIPGETRTIAISIYDRVQAFDDSAAGIMAATLLAISIVAISMTYLVGSRAVRGHG